jgi:hypothetical protein
MRLRAEERKVTSVFEMVNNRTSKFSEYNSNQSQPVVKAFCDTVFP